ncbi:hypothetical protein V9K67_22330 [Paraflavisolibacter sp. H34]|uniref:hypothetical protein n=1 Tax=Huijunlia imazamoxiresistens TaxID=3127457 RepID=UPI0030185065
MTPSQAYKSVFNEGGIKNFFDDLSIMEIIKGENTDLETEEIAKRTRSNLNIIANNILLLQEFESKNIETDFDSFLVRSLHESTLLKFHSVRKDMFHLFNYYDETEGNGCSKDSLLAEYLGRRFKVSPDEKQFLSLEWYSVIELALLSIQENINKLHFFYGAPLCFQITDYDQNFQVDPTPPYTEPNNLINSKIFFTLSFLHLLNYINFIVKYSILTRYKDPKYVTAIKEYKSNPSSLGNLDLYDFIFIDNYEDVDLLFQNQLNSRR